jgi:uncharacterized integral membrane protein
VRPTVAAASGVLIAALVVGALVASVIGLVRRRRMEQLARRAEA